MKVTRNVSLPPEVAAAAQVLNSKGVNISEQVERLIRQLAKKYKVKI